MKCEKKSIWNDEFIYIYKTFNREFIMFYNKYLFLFENFTEFLSILVFIFVETFFPCFVERN